MGYLTVERETEGDISATEGRANSTLSKGCARSSGGEEKPVGEHIFSIPSLQPVLDMCGGAMISFHSASLRGAR